MFKKANELISILLLAALILGTVSANLCLAKQGHSCCPKQKASCPMISEQNVPKATGVEKKKISRPQHDHSLPAPKAKETLAHPSIIVVNNDFIPPNHQPDFCYLTLAPPGV